VETWTSQGPGTFKNKGRVARILCYPKKGVGQWRTALNFKLKFGRTKSAQSFAHKILYVQKIGRGNSRKE